MEKKHYFIGFRKEFRDRLAKSMRVEATPLKVEEIQDNLDGHIYLKNLALFNPDAFQLLKCLKTCRKNGTKFICLEDGFCFDPTADTKPVRHTSLVKAKYPGIGQATFNILSSLCFIPEPVRRERIKLALIMIKSLNTEIMITEDLIADWCGISNEYVRTLIRKAEVNQMKQESKIRRKIKGAENMGNVDKDVSTESTKF
ncbi:MAG: hypothetical protein K2X93_29610 [Candidatus Obscuribacterales bacterium]|nr:hypothetical protein [Candidatus Obscuribacterales bacterium]